MRAWLRSSSCRWAILGDAGNPSGSAARPRPGAQRRIDARRRRATRCVGRSGQLVRVAKGADDIESGESAAKPKGSCAERAAVMANGRSAPVMGPSTLEVEMNVPLRLSLPVEETLPEGMSLGTTVDLVDGVSLRVVEVRRSLSGQQVIEVMFHVVPTVVQSIACNLIANYLWEKFGPKNATAQLGH